MPELAFTIALREPVLLPEIPLDVMQGLFYRLLSEDPELSRRIHGDGGSKFYSFTGLEGESRPSGEKRLWSGNVRWRFRSPDPRLTEVLYRRVAGDPAVRIGSADGEVTGAELSDRRIFTSCAEVTAATPLLAYHTAERRTFHSPGEREFGETVQNGLIRRYRLYTGSEPKGEVRFLPLDAEEERDRRVMTFKGSYLRGYMGKYLLAGPPEVLEFAYDAGLGSKTSAGFGAVGACVPLPVRRSSME